MSLYLMLKKSALKNPLNIAVVEKNKCVTYEELLNRVDELCLIFKKLKISEGVTIGLALHNSIEFIEYLYAFSKNGNTICLLDPNWNAEEINRKINSVSVDLVIAESYVLKKMEKNSRNSRCVILEKLHKNDNPKELTFDNILPRSQEYKKFNFELIQSTSGTTNLSKLGYRSAENIEIDSMNIVDELGYSENDLIFISVPMCHGYALTMGVISGIRSGATLYIQRWFAYKDFERNNKEKSFSVILGVPAMFECINLESSEKRLDLSSARWIFSSGDKIEEQTIRRFHELTGRWVSQVYGMMEVSTICINKSVDEESMLSVGKVFPGLELKLLPIYGSDLYEILIRGKTVSKMYICDNEMFSVTDEDGWFHTKDLGYMKKGLLYLEGRK